MVRMPKSCVPVTWHSARPPIFINHASIELLRRSSISHSQLQRCRYQVRCTAHGLPALRSSTEAADALRSSIEAAGAPCLRKHQQHAVMFYLIRAVPGAGLTRQDSAQKLNYAVREATVTDYWAIAEVHAQSFFPSANWLLGPLVRLDRVAAIQMGIDADQKSNQGRFSCLVACNVNEESGGEVEDLLSAPGNIAVPSVFQFLLAKPLRVGFYFSPERLGLLGSVVVDMQGQHLPVQRVQKGPFVAYEKPQGIAYISNLAVAPKARRQGVGEKLLKAAELVAQEWGCKRICLHCDPYNEAASALYSKFGYVKVATQGPSFLWLQMGPGARLQLTQKKLGDAD